MANKISVILDVATDKAVSGLKGFKQSVADADGAFGKIKAGGASAFDSIKQNAGLAAVGVVGAVGAMAAKSIEAASKLGESVNAVNVTFDESASGIKALGEEAAESIGLSNSAFNSLAVQFSSFAKTIAGEGGDVVATIDEMSTRAADFASVMNIDVADAASIFQSGLAGESEPLKKFGIDLSAAAVEAHALATGMVESKSEITEAIKVQARYSLLMKETEKTAGDFANTSDGLANSQRILAAKMEDTAAKVGKDLAPALAKITTAMSDLIPVAGDVAVAVGGTFDKITDAAYETGGFLVRAFDKIPGVTMDLGPEVEHTLKDIEELERASADLVAQFSEGNPTMQKFSERLQEAGVTGLQLSLAIVEYKKQLDGVNDSTGAAIDVTDELTGSTDELTGSTEKSTLAHWDAEESIKAIEEADKAATEAAEARVEAIENQVEALTALVGGDIAVRDAQREATAAVLELTTAMDAGELSAEELAAQTDATALELIGAASAAADYDEQLGEANGEILSAQGKQDLLRQKLEELAATLAPGSALRTQLQGYIDDLNSIPESRETRVFITGSGTGGTGQGPIRAPEFAEGGTVPGPIGAPTLAIVHGGEEVIPVNGNGNGHAPIAITVNAGLGANGAEIGDIIVSKIREYERRNGPNWRR